MSRTDIKGESFDLAFGVDHVTGAFVQLWVKPADDQDCAAVIIDSFGVVIDEEQKHHLNEPLLQFLERQKQRFVQWKKDSGDFLPNISEQEVIQLAGYAGFPDIAKEVYSVFD